MAANGALCNKGFHNPAVSRTHLAKNCYYLHPELHEKKRSKSKKQAKAAKADDSNNNSVPSGGAFLSVSKKKAFSTHGKTTMFLNSGCSDHMFPKKEYFLEYKKISSSIEMANRKLMQVKGSGYVFINNGLGAKIKLKAIHVLQIVHPLISSGRLYCKGCVTQKPGGDLNLPKFQVIDLHSNTAIFKGNVQGNVFVLAGSICQGEPSHFTCTLLAALLTKPDTLLLHTRYGNPSKEALKIMFGVESSTLDCCSCRLFKSTLHPLSKTLPTSSSVLSFVYMDLSGKSTPPRLGGGLYTRGEEGALPRDCHSLS
jgi:hypothetical protein